MPLTEIAQPTLFYLFSLFWDDALFELLAVNTHLYAKSKEKPSSGSAKPRVCQWKETTAAELRIFIGLTIKIVLHKKPRLGLYWSKRGRNRWRKISKRPLRRY